MKNVAVLTEDGAFALFFRPHPGRFWHLKSPHPQEFAIQGKKNADHYQQLNQKMPGGLPRGGMLKLRFDRYIIQS